MNKFHKPFCTTLVVQLLREKGFSSIQKASLDILTDAYVKFIENTALNSVDFAELCDRDKTSFEDVTAALENNNMGLKELLRYSLNSKMYPKDYPSFPAPSKCKLNFPEEPHDQAHIPDHLPSQNFHFEAENNAEESLAEIDPNTSRNLRKDSVNEPNQEAEQMDFEVDQNEMSPVKSPVHEEVVQSDQENQDGEPDWVREQTIEIEANKRAHSQGIGASVGEKFDKDSMFSPDSSDYYERKIETQIESAQRLIQEGFESNELNDSFVYGDSPKRYADEQPDSPMGFEDSDNEEVYPKSPVKKSSGRRDDSHTYMRNSPALSSDDDLQPQPSYAGTSKSSKRKFSEEVKFEDFEASLPVIKLEKPKKKKKDKKDKRKRKMSDQFDMPPIKIPKVKIKETPKKVVEKYEPTPLFKEKSVKKKEKKDKKNREKHKEKEKSRKKSKSSEVFEKPQIKIKFTNIAPVKKSPVPPPVVAPPKKEKQTKKQSSKHKAKSTSSKSTKVEKVKLEKVKVEKIKAEKEPVYQQKSRVTTQTIEKSINKNIEFDEDGNKIWYCPACGGPDDGSQMIGCDNEENCDNWYHYPCVNITETPADDEKWFCPECTKSKKSKKKKKRY